MHKICPHCHKMYSVPKHSGDFVHQCNSGQNSLDKEDVLKLDNPNWNLQGIENKASPLAKAEGVDVEDIGKRGKRKSTHKTRQHFQYIK